MKGNAERLNSTRRRDRRTTCPRSGGLTLLAVAATIVLAGCGGSKSPSVASVATTSSSSASSTNISSGGASSGSTTPGTSNMAAELVYANCMRSNGLPNFPDPRPGGGFQLGAGVDPSSTVFKAAQAKCQKLLSGGVGLPGSGPPPSAQAMAQMLKVSECMRRHGVPRFPDPMTSAPSNLPAGGGVVSDRDGVILVLPSSLDMQSPLFLRAAATCGFQLTNH